MQSGLALNVILVATGLLPFELFIVWFMVMDIIVMDVT